VAFTQRATHHRAKAGDAVLQHIVRRAGFQISTARSSPMVPETTMNGMLKLLFWSNSRARWVEIAAG